MTIKDYSDVSFTGSGLRKVLGVEEYGEKFFGFMLKYFQHYLTHSPSPMHREFTDLVKFSRVAIAAPRTFAKSIIMSTIYPIFVALKEPKSRIVIVSATSFLATDLIRRIKGEFEGNEFFRLDFGDLTSDKWREDHIVLSNGSEIIARSVTSQIRGLHPKVLILDDAENDEEAMSEDGRDGFQRFMKNTIMPTLNFEHCQLLMVGTLLHPESYLTRVVNGHELGWTSRLYRAITNDNKSLWPDLWSLARLNDMKRDLGTDAFEQEFQNNPIPDNQRAFKKAWFQNISSENVPKLVNRFVTVDPAIALGEKNDDTAICIVSVDSEKNMYVEECISGKMIPNEIIQTLFSIYERKKVLVTGIETIAFAKTLHYMFQDECRRRKVYPHIEELKSDGRRKTWRIRALQPYFEQGKIFFVQGGEGLEKLEKQLLSFPTGRFDDCADALAYVLSIMRPGQKPKPEPLHPDSFDGVLDRLERERNVQEVWGNHQIWH